MNVTATCDMAQHRANRNYNCDGLTFSKMIRCVCKVEIINWGLSIGAQVGVLGGYTGGKITGVNSADDASGWGNWGIGVGFAIGPLAFEGGGDLRGSSDISFPAFGFGVSLAIRAFNHSWVSNPRYECKRDSLYVHENRLVKMARDAKCPCTHKDVRNPHPYPVVDWIP